MVGHASRGGPGLAMRRGKAQGRQCIEGRPWDGHASREGLRSAMHRGKAQVSYAARARPPLARSASEEIRRPWAVPSRLAPALEETPQAGWGCLATRGGAGKTRGPGEAVLGESDSRGGMPALDDAVWASTGIREDPTRPGGAIWLLAISANEGRGPGAAVPEEVRAGAGQEAHRLRAAASLAPVPTLRVRRLGPFEEDPPNQGLGRALGPDASKEGSPADQRSSACE